MFINLRLPLSTPYMQEIRHHLTVLNIRILPDGFIVGLRLVDLFQHKTRPDDGVDPFGKCAGEPGDFEFRKFAFQVDRRCAEDPFLYLPIRVSEIIADFYGIGLTISVPEIFSVRCTKTRM